jgi:hypothetical protein
MVSVPGMGGRGGAATRRARLGTRARYGAPTPDASRCARVLPTLVLCATLALSACGSAHAPTGVHQGQASGASHGNEASLTAAEAVASKPLSQLHRVIFGIAPTGPSGPELLSRLVSLASKQRFLLHLYVPWHASYKSSPPWLQSTATQISSYARAGLSSELVVRYESDSGDASGYASFIGTLVQRYHHLPGLVALQVTNEADSPIDKAASDGGYPNVIQALVRGVETAASAVTRSRSHLVVGFNVADLPTQLLVDWFSALGKAGGPAFDRSVGFVGLDIYPGTYYPSLPQAGSPSLASAASRAVAGALESFRSSVLPAAGIGSSTSIELTEIGFATSTRWHHSDAEQSVLVRAFAEGACSVASRTGLAAFEWFDLTDAAAPSASLSNPSFALPWRFGLLRHDLEPKPAFSTYRSVVQSGCMTRR